MSYSSEVLADSPLLYLRMGESSGTTMTDSSGNGRNGTYVGSPTFGATGAVGDGDTATTFNGTTQSGSVADAAWMDVTTASVETWFKTTASGDQQMTGRWDSQSTSRQAIYLDFVSAGQIRVIARISGATRIVSAADTGLRDGNWHHVVGTYDGTTLALYVDGTLASSAAWSGTLPNIAFEYQVALRTGTGRFNGTLDEVAFYGGALSAARVLAHYNSASGGTTLNGGLPVETDTALAGITHQKIVGGIATETDSALTGALGSFVSLGRAIESSTALAASLLVGSVVAGGVAVEVDEALPFYTPTVLGLPVEVDEALPGEVVLGYSLTDTTNRVGGRQRGGIAEVAWEPPVVVPDAFPLLVHNYDKARAFTAPVVVNGRPSYAATEIAAPATRPRILVGGKDVTFFRGVPTPAPGYRLIEPLDYGAGTLELPQVSPAFETLGTGALKWLRKGKTVIVQRVNTATNTVVSTTYRGFITDFSIRGNTLVCDLGGVVAGRAALRDRQPVLFRQVKDVGNWVYSAITQSAGVRFTPRLGPVTGIELASRGGTSMLDYINELLALSVHQSGAQWTVGRRPNGTWGMWLKDTTTIDATIYLDDARMVADLHQSLAEEPNRIFVTCISPDGRRIKFGAYPGFKQGDPPPYPFTAGTPFGEGTTNAMTNTGDGITVMLAHLVTMSYLTPKQNDGAFDAQVTRAIKRLQDDAGLTESGIMNPATWDALYDLSATGYSIVNARILPAAQRPSVKPWNLTASGAISSRNSAHDRTVEVVDRTVNLGAGFTVQEARQYARDLLREANTPNWVGTITCHLAAIRGEHNPGDPIAAADLMPAHSVKPGMNVWLPTFQGGMLVHVSGAEHPANDGSPVLTVDTRHRDTMAAWECITRNWESRHNPARAWLNNHRQSEMTKDHFNEWDEISGILDDSVRLVSGWNVFPVKAGQAGTTSWVRIHTVDDKTRFMVLMFTRPVTPERLTAWNPQPLTAAGYAKWDNAALRNKLMERGMVYIAGSDKNPCGLWPGFQTNEDNTLTGDPVTGKWEDDAGFGWQTFAEPVLYVAVWALEPCRIRAGRIMQNQLEAGA